DRLMVDHQRSDAPQQRPDSGASHGQHPLWTPSPQRVAESAMGRFIADRGVGDYAGLHEWSLADPAGFWTDVWDRCGIVGERGDRVVAEGATMRESPFFPDAQLSIVESVVRHGGDAAAIIAVDESGSRAMSWDELAVEVGAMAAALADVGVGEGDRVAVWLPNGIE